MIELKSAGELDAIGAAGAVVGSVLSELSQRAAPGVSPHELNEIAVEKIAESGSRPSFLDYHPGFAPFPYPAVICASVNDAVVHSIPSRQPLRDGDLLSIDLAVHLDGWCADAAFSTVIGSARDGDLDLIDTTERALQAGIAAAVPGARIGDIAHAIGKVGRAGRYGLLANHGGHGVGRAMHEAPFVPNEGRRRRGYRLLPGLVLALEPMFLAGGRDDYQLDPDGWTLRTADGSRAAHAEHTIAVTDDGPRILTGARPTR